jgi:hypothetical protein
MPAARECERVDPVGGGRPAASDETARQRRQGDHQDQQEHAVRRRDIHFKPGDREEEHNTANPGADQQDCQHKHACPCWSGRLCLERGAFNERLARQPVRHARYAGNHADC